MHIVKPQKITKYISHTISTLIRLKKFITLARLTASLINFPTLHGNRIIPVIWKKKEKGRLNRCIRELIDGYRSLIACIIKSSNNKYDKHSMTSRWWSEKEEEEEREEKEIQTEPRSCCLSVQDIARE